MCNHRCGPKPAGSAQVHGAAMSSHSESLVDVLPERSDASTTAIGYDEIDADAVELDAIQRIMAFAHTMIVWLHQQPHLPGLLAVFLQIQTICPRQLWAYNRIGCNFNQCSKNRWAEPMNPRLGDCVLCHTLGCNAEYIQLGTGIVN